MPAKRVIFKGSVQGVGFRATTLEQSARYDVYGYVKNLEDGTVELVAQGKEREVLEFIDDISNTLKDYIQSKEVKTCDPLDEYRDFRIEYD